MFIIPQTFFTGYQIDPAYLAEVPNGQTSIFLHNSAKQLQTSIICGLVTVEKSQYEIRSYAFPNILQIKSIPFRVSNDEKYKRIEFFAERQHFFIAQNRLILICCDVRRSITMYSDQKVESIVYIGNWPPLPQAIWKIMLQAKQLENDCCVLGCCRIDDLGVQNDIVYYKPNNKSEVSCKECNEGFYIFK
ncbi:Omega-amidase [Spironucleus salmonicida]|uniref:Omega-amidase n=1 Tax=Spironucleus salmonicida TaxID=348837 RepID=V6M2P3_9EUKA|nr:Omega-amidase [Spironucleus salmonicida]|eukprot:EST47529.1 hypothetical protein SS50377_12513 [Spironucleus salmonicida]